MRTRVLIAPLLALLGACSRESKSPVDPTVTLPANVTVFPGFDTSIYPGDATMGAWLYPSSPYYWSGYYLPAPCHRDVTWTNKYATLHAMGWGLTAMDARTMPCGSSAATASRRRSRTSTPMR